ncbi:DUF456 domain-containing protein [Streptomyces albidoflavus]|uniref:DUF456 domain-containing protein n=1 Tax=Streptomyces TaxID=1883 RepID=UPI0003C2C1E5|nr:MULTISPECIES: DUF456 domain-containing protein [unclassified Streptomyces]ESQ06961.1 small hydrophobic protein membrane protein [Streptomyces sp. PVA_94-07]MBP3076575.1 membrane protein [Streptomyces sp. 604F]QHV88199.1 DUF456 domain-containing protein [Streptomyces sp. 604F]WSB23377.1 DUF456 domain-containing protein [Streptomyces albidoflavus]
MGAWELLLVGVVMVLGLVGVLVPGLPGTWLVWAATLWWALQDQSSTAWGVLVGASVLLLLAQLVRWQLPGRSGDPMGARLAQWAGWGALAGFVVVPVVGALPGALVGLYVAERVRLGRRDDAAASVRDVLRRGGWRVLVELFACLLVAGAWVGALVWG